MSVTSRETRQLIIGKEVSVTGEIASCDRLVVEGRVQAAIVGCVRLEVSASGVFSGTANVEQADIAGQFSGTLYARHLRVGGSARVNGTIAYDTIEIERGGLILGSLRANQPEAQQRMAFLMSEQFETEMQAHFTDATRIAIASHGRRDAKARA